ncbi:MAG: enoyl-CoA hydratase [Desulfobacteraceae bacterium]|nr:enoyl-CoA hydratase [Desulfobacteraceae bacterium]
MTEPVILIEKKDHIAIVTLNRPKAMNALSTELRAAIHDTFMDLKNDGSIAVAILTVAGRAFCAGLDLKELASKENMAEKSTGERKPENHLTYAIKTFGRPVIGAINGVAITGGFELALACDILVASTEAKFADTHARVGILPGAGLSQKLSRLIGIYRAKEVSLTGNFISADQAEAWGLVNRVVEPAQLLPTCEAIANDILSCPQDMVQAYKKLIDDGFQVSFGEGIALEREVNYAQFKTVKSEAIAQRREGILERGRKQKK